jgi:hypothetical protein
MKTTLTVEIEYDPKMTDPEGLACAMDRLLETALSTPDIFSDYGNPRLGEFFLATEGTTPLTPKEINTMNEPNQYTLRIDGPAFRAQRKLLIVIADLVHCKRHYEPSPGDEQLLEGLLNLTDAIADQAHDQHGIDCLLNDENATRCEG